MIVVNDTDDLTCYFNLDQATNIAQISCIESKPAKNLRCVWAVVFQDNGNEIHRFPVPVAQTEDRHSSIWLAEHTSFQTFSTSVTWNGLAGNVSVESAECSELYRPR